MPWPWRRRKSSAVPTVARHAAPRQASWAEPAFPPAAPQGTPVAVPVQASGVLLGFADGSQVRLDEGDPHAVALRAVASILSEHRRPR